MISIKPVAHPAETWEHAAAPDLTLRGVDLRQPNRPTLQFIHGIAFASKVYWPLLAPLAEDYGLFLHDLQGHGDSDLGNDYSGWEASMERVLAVMAAKGIDPATGPVIGSGHSYGASLHMLIAAARPERFSALVLLDPMLMPQNMFELFERVERNPMIERVLKKTAVWDDRNEARAYLRSKAAFKNWHDEAIEAFLDHAMAPHGEVGLALRCPPPFEVQVLSRPLLTLWDAVERLRTPTVILYGDDPMSPIGPSCRKAAEMNPHIRAMAMTGGHNFMLERPGESADAVRAALEMLLGDTGNGSLNRTG